MNRHASPRPVARKWMGENAPSASPGDDPTLYGSAVLEGPECAEVRSYQSYRLTYKVGRLGLDDTGGIRIAFRIISEMGKLQTINPKADNYCTADCSGEGQIRLIMANDGQRPWMQTVTAKLQGGYLSEGDTITIRLGDTDQGSFGWLMQTYVEAGFEFRIMTDVQATGNYQPLDDQFAIRIISGPVYRWLAVLPTLRRPDEPFHLGLKAEDIWGNPANSPEKTLELRPNRPVNGLPDSVVWPKGATSLTLDNLTVSMMADVRIDVLMDGTVIATAGPLTITDRSYSGYWGDLHGQSGETVGIGTIDDYFDFARNIAFLDVCAHQGNDFQITPDFWDHLNQTTARWNEPDRFTVFPGYEWSGNTAVGGDHNVFFREEGQIIHRCSHALLEDRRQIETDAHDLTELYKALQSVDCVLYAHIGGRYANIPYDHDPVLETAVEIHSAWGTFPWVLKDSLKLGRRIGIVANSDGHKGRPGAEFPGASHFGAYGGLTCFLASENTRGAIMESQRRRHHYATTGCRMDLHLNVDLPEGSLVFHRDPRHVRNAERTESTSAIMGDIVSVAGETVDFNVQVQAASGIIDVAIYHGTECVETVRSCTTDDLGARYRILCHGAEYRGRGRDTHWQCKARFEQTGIQHIQPVNVFNPERRFEQSGSDTVLWECVTTGNFTGFDVWLREHEDVHVQIDSNFGSCRFALDEPTLAARCMPAGGLDRRITVQQLPDTSTASRMTFSRSCHIPESGDLPLWVMVTMEDGHQAWSSPIYLARDATRTD